MKQIRTILMSLLICVLLGLTVFLGACKKNTNTTDNTGDTIQDSEEVETQVDENLENAKNAISGENLTDEQKANEALGSYDGTNVAKIEASGRFYYDSSFSGTQINVALTDSSDDGDIHLYFDGTVSIAGSKPVIKSETTSNNVIITLLSGANVTFENTNKNAVNVLGDLTINGAGSLTVSSANKNGIKCDGKVYILDAHVTVSSAGYYDTSIELQDDWAEGSGINASAIYLDGASVTVLAAGKDGLHAEMSDAVTSYTYDDGYVYIKDSVVTISGVHGDAVQADTFVYIESGTVNLSTSGDFVQGASSSTDYDYKKSGSSYYRIGGDERGDYYLYQSSKGIKVGTIDYDVTTDGGTTEYEASSENYLIYIDGGSLTISSTDDAIHTNSGNVVIAGGTLNLTTLDDGLHADKALSISGGTINISSSYEAIEGETVTVSGGTVVAYAKDDGINAANSDLTESAQKTKCYIKISGGKLYVNADGDGIDSNGGVLITGGETYVYGPQDNGNGALDSESGIIVNGGILVAVGSSGMAEQPSSSSSQYFVIKTVSSTNGNVVLKDSSGNALVSFTITDHWTASKTYTSVIISSPKIVSGTKYTLTAGSNSTTVTGGASTNSGGNNGGMPSDFGGGNAGSGGGPGGRG